MVFSIKHICLIDISTNAKNQNRRENDRLERKRRMEEDKQRELELESAGFGLPKVTGGYADMGFGGMPPLQLGGQMGAQGQYND